MDTVESDPASGLMRLYKRRVTTHIGSGERTVREVWTLRTEIATETASE